MVELGDFRPRHLPVYASVGHSFSIGRKAWTGGIDSTGPLRSIPISQIARAPQSENVVSPKRRAPGARTAGKSKEKISAFGTVRDVRRWSRGRYGPSSALHRGLRQISWSGATLRGALSACTYSHELSGGFAALQPISVMPSGQNPGVRVTPVESARHAAHESGVGSPVRARAREERGVWTGPRGSTLEAAYKVN